MTAVGCDLAQGYYWSRPMPPLRSWRGWTAPDADRRRYRVHVSAGSEWEREVVRVWQHSARALRQVRIEELRRLDDADALAAANTLLELLPTVPHRRTSSGLIEQQRLFHARKV